MALVVAFMDDLLFLSRVREAAGALGLELQTARATDPLLTAVRSGARLVLVDADSDRLPWAAGLAALRAEPACAAVPVVAFVSHVHAERAKAAQAAGASRVLARGAFVRELPRLLAAVTEPPLENVP